MANKCKKCLYEAPSGFRLKEHLLTVHSDLRPWKCTFEGCDYATKFRACLKIHSQKHETDPELKKPYACTSEGCRYRAAMKSTLKKHLWVKHPIAGKRQKSFLCPLCPSKFHTGANLKGHINGCHTKEATFKCGHCSFKAHRKGGLAHHVKVVHEKSKEYNCCIPDCKFKTTHCNSIIAHRQAHLSDPILRRPVPCTFPDCSHRAISTSHFKQHLQSCHNLNRPKDFSCPFCSRPFYKKAHLGNHIRYVHTNEKWHSCDKCEYGTNYTSQLQLHNYRIHGQGNAPEKRFKCEKCNYSSYLKRSLDLHEMTSHTRMRQFRCQVRFCIFKTNHISVMQKHSLIHEQDPEKQFPFACSFPRCDFRRRTKSQILSHERRHTETPKPHPQQNACKLCLVKFDFPDRTSLKFHEWSCHKKGSYSCSICGFEVFMRRNLVTHVRKCHDQFIGSFQKPRAKQESEVGTRALVRCHRGTESTGEIVKTPVVLLQQIILKMI